MPRPQHVEVRRGPTRAWYPEGWREGDDKAQVLVWVAPADGAWTVHLEGLPGEPRRHEGLKQHEADALALVLLGYDLGNDAP